MIASQKEGVGGVLALNLKRPVDRVQYTDTTMLKTKSLVMAYHARPMGHTHTHTDTHPHTHTQRHHTYALLVSNRHTPFAFTDQCE